MSLSRNIQVTKLQVPTLLRKHCILHAIMTQFIALKYSGNLPELQLTNCKIHNESPRVQITLKSWEIVLISNESSPSIF